MIDPPASEHERRVLILGPTPRDGRLIADVLRQSGIPALACADSDRLLRALEDEAAAVLVTEEAVREIGGVLRGAVAAQPAWSDLPILLLTVTGADSPTVMGAIETLGNVTLLERPIRVTALIAAVRTALRSRLRQYETHAYLAERERIERSRKLEIGVARLLSLEDSDDPVPRVLQAVIEGLGWEAGALWEPSERDGRLRSSAFCSRSGKALPQLEAATRATSFGRGEGLPGRVFETGEPVWITDVMSDGNFPRRDAAAAGDPAEQHARGAGGAAAREIRSGRRRDHVFLLA